MLEGLSQHAPASPYALLLLPTPPNPPNTPAIRAAFKLPLERVLRKLCNSPDAPSGAATLDITVPCVSHKPQARVQQFEAVAQILAEIYSLLNTLFRRLRIPATGPGTVDARLLPLAWDAKYKYTPVWTREQSRLECLVDLPILVESQRKWTHLFTVESEQGERLYQQFRLIAVDRTGSGRVQTLSSKPHRVPGGIVLNSLPSLSSKPKVQASPHDQIMVVDEFENRTFAHKLLLTMAAFLIEPPSSVIDPDVNRARRLIIAISDNALRLDKVQLHQPLEARRSAIEAYMTGILDFCPPDISPHETASSNALTKSLTVSYEYVREQAGLATPFENLSAIIFAADNVKYSVAMNARRHEKGRNALESFRTPPVHSEVIDEDDET